MFRITIREICLLTIIISLVCVIARAFLTTEQRVEQLVEERAEERVRKEVSQAHKTLDEARKKMEVENGALQLESIALRHENSRHVDRYARLLNQNYLLWERLRTAQSETPDAAP
jgi:hypothetical protein